MACVVCSQRNKPNLPDSFPCSQCISQQSHDLYKWLKLPPAETHFYAYLCFDLSTLDSKLGLGFLVLSLPASISRCLSSCLGLDMVFPACCPLSPSSCPSASADQERLSRQTTDLPPREPMGLQRWTPSPTPTRLHLPGPAFSFPSALCQGSRPHLRALVCQLGAAHRLRLRVGPTLSDPNPSRATGILLVMTWETVFVVCRKIFYFIFIFVDFFYFWQGMLIFHFWLSCHVLF